MDKISLGQSIGYGLVRKGRIITPKGRTHQIEHGLSFNNPIFVQQIRDGKVLRTIGGHNGITIEGKNHLLDVTFGGGTQVDPWYIGLIDQSPTPTLVEADTLASHAGWTEHTAYAGNRKAWVDAAASAKVKGTTTASQFDINATGEVHGIFIASVDTGTAGTLWATGGFDASLPVVNGDELKITYGVRT